MVTSYTFMLIRFKEIPKKKELLTACRLSLLIMGWSL